jgi:hypothetical protein
MRVLFTAVRDIIFLFDLFTELGFTVEQPIDVHEDNAACVILANQQFGPYKNVKHFLVLYFGQQVHPGYIKVQDIDTKKNISDILIKDLFNSILFKKHLSSQLGIQT